MRWLLGEVRRRALLDRFGSVAAIRKASVSEIAAVPGIGDKIAELIAGVVTPSATSGTSVNTATGEILS